MVLRKSFGYRVRALSLKVFFFVSRFEDFFAAQHLVYPLWFIVGMVGGAGVYFLVDEEPSWHVVVSLLVVGCVLFFVRLYSAFLRAFFLFCLVVIGGMACGMASVLFHVHTHVAPFFDVPKGVVSFEGTIVHKEGYKDGWRFVLSDVVIMSRHKGDVVAPSKVRVRMRGFVEEDIYRVGMRVSGRGQLFPPSMPAYPRGFDFMRKAWFQGIGAFGYSFGILDIQEDAPPDMGWRGALRDAHSVLLEKIRASLDGDGREVAAALLLGSRGRIDEEVWHVMRLAGLAHLLALSGLHMGLVTGFVFLLLWKTLTLWRWASFVDVRKLAACLAWCVGFLYLFVTGASLPTTRAFIMVSFVFLAILLDRRAFSLYTIGWAAVVIIIREPYAVIDVGFQMSFAAALALVAYYEHSRRYIVYEGDGHEEEKGARCPVAVLWASAPIRVIRRYMGAVFVTTLVAGAATMPLVAYHFHHVVAYGVLANMVAVPLTAFWIMPIGILSLPAMALDLHGVFLSVMAQGITWMIEWARYVITLPRASMVVAPLPVMSMLLFVCGFLWLALWERVSVLPAILLWLCAIVLIAQDDTPDIWISGDGRVVALRDTRGERQWVLSSKANGWEREQWLQAYGDGDRDFLLWDDRRDSGDDNAPLRCDSEACVYRAHGHVVSIVSLPSALPTACRKASLIIFLEDGYPVPACGTPVPVIARAHVEQWGSHVVSLPAGAEPTWTNTRDITGTRIWHRP